MCRLQMIDEGGEDWQSLGFEEPTNFALVKLKLKSKKYLYKIDL
jgi:hypothetical protein